MLRFRYGGVGPRMAWDGRLLGAIADPSLVVDAAAIHASA